MGGTLYDHGYGIALDGLGNVYTTGHFKDTCDFDPGVGTFDLISAGLDDIFISKLDILGNFVWAKQIGESSTDVGTSIVVDDSGNVYSAGYFYGVADFDPGSGTTNLTSAGAYDEFVLKLNTSGNFIWAKNMGGMATDIAKSIAVDVAGNVYTTGQFQGTADFDPNSGILNLTSAGGMIYLFLNWILLEILCGPKVWAERLVILGYRLLWILRGMFTQLEIFLGRLILIPDREQLI